MIGEGAVLAPNVVAHRVRAVIDVTGAGAGRAPRRRAAPGSVVVPGTRPKDFPAGTYQLACALIVGWRERVDRPEDSA